jgi:hypothetical protein
MSKAKESKRQRDERIAESNNGTTLRTRVVPNKKKKKRIKRVDWEIELEEE